MAIEYKRFQHSVVEERLAAALARVDAIADELRSALEDEAVAIDSAHVHGASSSAVQAIASSI